MTNRILAVGGVVLAGTIMIMNGVFQFLEGLAAVVNKDFYVATRHYVFDFDVNAWGWIHLLLGAIVAIAGVCLMLGQTWARALAVVLALLSAVTNFMFIPYYPVWSIIIILLDVLVIWAVLSYDRPDAREA